MFIILILTINYPSICVAGETEVYEFDKMWPTLKQPWYSWLVSDLTIDNRGYIYFPDSIKGIIHKYTTNGQFVNKWTIEPAYQGIAFYAISFIAVCPKGNIYIYDVIDNLIHKYSFDGKLIEKLKKDVFRYQSPSDIDIDVNGCIYIAENKSIMKFSEDGRLISKWGENHIESISSIAVDSKGYIYVTDNKKNCVYQFDSVGELLRQWGNEGTAKSEFNNPLGVDLDYSGNIFVVDNGNYRIQKFDKNGQFLTMWGKKGNYDGQFNFPSGISVDKNGFVYISDSGYSRIQKFTNSGEFIDIWTGISLNDGLFNEPDDVAIDSEDNIYIADAKNYRIQKFNKDGQFLLKWGEKGAAEGQFDLFLTDNINADDTSMGLAIDNNDTIYVVDSGNHRIQKFDNMGNYLGEWGKEGNNDGNFSRPYDIAIDYNNYVYVSDTGNDCIQKFDKEGVFIYKISGKNDSFTIQDPTALAIDIDNSLYIINIGTFKILKFNSDGNYENVWKTYEQSETNVQYIRYPQSIAVDKNGYIYISEGLPLPIVKSQINKYTPKGELITTYGEFGSNAGQFYFTGDICINNNGDIIVTDRYNHRVQILKKELTTIKSKAIIVAGGSKDDILWPETQKLAYFAYRSLNYQGFSKSQLCYLSSDPNIDLDGNGAFDDVYDATIENLQDKIITWADGADDLIVYLVDHGGKGIFWMSESEPSPLSAYQLDQWLNSAQMSISGRIVLVYDACYSGSFLKYLKTSSSNIKRIIITSTQENVAAQFNGPVSFSNFFWSHIFNNYSLYESFEYSQNACMIVNQNEKVVQIAQIDSNGNGYGNENEDIQLSKHIYIGNQLINQKDIPLIRAISPEQTINSNSTTIYAELSDSAIYQVWAEIIPPSFDLTKLKDKPLLSLPTCILHYKGNKHYENIYDGFNMAGTYLIKVYSRSKDGTMSIPKQTKVYVNNPKRRKAIIIAGETELSIWTSVEKSLRLSYEAMLFQGYSEDDIYFISPITFSTGVDASATLDNVDYAFSGWALNNTNDLIVYIIGNGENEQFILNATEKLSAHDLSYFLDNVQQHIDEKITVIYDSDFSKSFLPIVSTGRSDRILICGTEKKFLLDNGDVCLSTIFWRNILNGNNINESFVKAKRTNRTYSKSTDEPQLDDNGNGQGNETESSNVLPKDGHIAENYWIGLGIISSGIDSNLPIDIYEENNKPNQANIINSGAPKSQIHNFHFQNDTDWIVFYGINNKNYRIDITEVKMCNVMFQLYDQELNPKLITPVDDKGYEGDESTIWFCENEGIYFINIQNVNNNNFGEHTSYQIAINTTDAPFPGDIQGQVSNAITKEPISMAKVKTNSINSNNSALSDEYSSFCIYNHEIGTFTIYVEADGYYSYSDTIKVKQLETTFKNIALYPLRHPGLFNLSLNITGECGSVLINEIECNANCSNMFQKNTFIKITSNSNQTCKFIDWSGDCTGSNECQFSIDKNKTVYANFELDDTNSDNQNKIPPPKKDDDDDCCCFISLISDILVK